MAAFTLKARDDNGPRIALQLLVYLALQHGWDTHCPLRTLRLQAAACEHRALLATLRNQRDRRRFTGLVCNAPRTGDSDRKGQPMSKAGSSLRITLVRAANFARMQDPQLACIHYQQMTERGKLTSRTPAGAGASSYYG